MPCHQNSYVHNCNQQTRILTWHLCTVNDYSALLARYQEGQLMQSQRFLKADSWGSDITDLYSWPLNHTFTLDLDSEKVNQHATYPGLRSNVVCTNRQTDTHTHGTDYSTCSNKVVGNYDLWQEQRLKSMYLGTKFTDKASYRILVDNWLIHNVLGTLGIQQRVDRLRVA